MTGSHLPESVVRAEALDLHDAEEWITLAAATDMIVDRGQSLERAELTLRFLLERGAVRAAAGHQVERFDSWSGIPPQEQRWQLVAADFWRGLEIDFSRSVAHEGLGGLSKMATGILISRSNLQDALPVKPATTARRGTVSVRSLSTFLLAIPGPARTKRQLQELAEEHFKARVPRRIFDHVYSSLPSGKRRARGEHDRTLKRNRPDNTPG